MKLLTIATTLILSSSAFAAATHKCGELDSIGNLVGVTKTIGNVKVAYVSTEEPAAAPDHVLIFVYDNEMGQSCTAISRDAEGNGFGYVDMSTLKSIAYDSKKGRLLEITVSEPNFEGGNAKQQTIKFRANAANGKVTLE